MYLFKANVLNQKNIKGIQKNSVDYKIMEQMTEMWVNFAKTG